MFRYESMLYFCLYSKEECPLFPSCILFVCAFFLGRENGWVVHKRGVVGVAGDISIYNKEERQLQLQAVHNVPCLS